MNEVDEKQEADFYKSMWNAIEKQEYVVVILNMKKNKLTVQRLGEILYDYGYFEGSEYASLMLPIIDYFLNNMNYTEET